MTYFCAFLRHITLLGLLFIPIKSFATSLQSGDLDPTFGINGVSDPIFESGIVIQDIAIQSDGKIVAVGFKYSTITLNDFVIMRFLENGDLDSSFANNGVLVQDMSAIVSGFTEGVFALQDMATAVAIQKLTAGDKIVVAGYADYQISLDLVVVRYNLDGTFDTSFGTDGITTFDINGSADKGLGLSIYEPTSTDYKHKIVVVGATFIGDDPTTTKPVDQLIITRFNQDGSLDTSFNSQGFILESNSGVDSFLYDHYYPHVDTQDNGKIAVSTVAGTTYIAANSVESMLFRYNGDGTVDTSFSTDGFLEQDLTSVKKEGPFGTFFYQSGKILTAETSDDYSILSPKTYYLVLRNSDGTLASSFASSGVLTQTTQAEYSFTGVKDDLALGILSTDQIVLASEETNPTSGLDVGIHLYNSDGSAVTSFGSNGFKLYNLDASDNVDAIAIDDNDRIVLVINKRKMIRVLTDTDIDLDGDSVTVAAGDCLDNDANTYPGAVEICDGKDNDCDGVIDEGLNAITYYFDSDKDSFGDPNTTTTACQTPVEYVDNNSDCDDDNSNINPDITETCNLRDDNCNGQVDEGVTNTLYFDNDGDGHGGSNLTITGCLSSFPNYVFLGDDCNDNDDTVYPDATEICGDTIDQSCSGADLACPVDADGDGSNSDVDCNDNDATINPNASEKCGDGIDQNCDGVDTECVNTDGDTNSDGDETVATDPDETQQENTDVATNCLMVGDETCPSSGDENTDDDTSSTASTASQGSGSSGCSLTVTETHHYNSLSYLGLMLIGLFLLRRARLSKPS